MNERIVAGLDAFDSRPPERGEVILFDHAANKSKYLKRVIAVGGDTVSPGPNGAILVNGKEFKFPKPCGTSAHTDYQGAALATFEPQTLAQDTYFVIGDNLNNSFDSRLPNFGSVRRDQVRGKVLMIYWSSNISRIGCRIQ